MTLTPKVHSVHKVNSWEGMLLVIVNISPTNFGDQGVRLPHYSYDYTGLKNVLVSDLLFIVDLTLTRSLGCKQRCTASR